MPRSRRPLIMRGLYWRIRIVWKALRWVPLLNLGDRVSYEGREWTLLQGVQAPIWKLYGDYGPVSVHENDFRKVRSVSNYWHSFRSGYGFYMGYWHSIWVSQGWSLDHRIAERRSRSGCDE